MNGQVDGRLPARPPQTNSGSLPQINTGLSLIFGVRILAGHTFILGRY
jgi:hypothetical protein